MSDPIIAIRGTVRTISSIIYMLQIILTVPLSFEIGGNKCGLAFSFTLFLLYSLLNTIRILFLINGNHRKSKLRYVFYLQHICIPSLFIFFLSINNISNTNLHYSASASSFHFFPNSQSLLPRFITFLNHYYINIWNFFLKNSTPLFVLLEGICSLLLIQAIGKSFNYLLNKRKFNKNDDNGSSNNNYIPTILNLLISGTILTVAIFFLYNIYLIPELKINLLSSTLLGAVITFCFGVSLFGIISLRSSLIESVLIFAYIVKCIYQTFPELTTNANNQFNDILKQISENFKEQTLFPINNDNYYYYSVLRHYDANKNFLINFYNMNFKHFFSQNQEQLIDNASKTVGTVVTTATSVINGVTVPIGNLNSLLASNTSIFFSIITKIVSNNKSQKFWISFYRSCKVCLKLITLNLTNGFISLSLFMIDAIINLRILIIFNLAYRILVFYCATRIIPALKKSSNSSSVVQMSNSSSSSINKLNLSDSKPSSSKVNKSDASGTIQEIENDYGSNHQDKELDDEYILDIDEDEADVVSSSPISLSSNSASTSYASDLKLSSLLYSYSPCVIIMLYTNLILLHRNEIDPNVTIWGWWTDMPFKVNQIQFWNWLNMFLILVLYIIELVSEKTV